MLPVVGFILFVLVAVAWYRIFRRLGWPPFWGLTMVLPPVVIVISAVMYFQQWPLERKVVELEQEIARLRDQISQDL